MSSVKKSIGFLKSILVTFALSPLFFTIASSLPGLTAVRGTGFVICGPKTLEKELKARKLTTEISPEDEGKFREGVNMILAEKPDFEQARSKFEFLLATPLAKTTALQMNLGVAYALCGRLQEASTATEEADIKRNEGLISSLRQDFLEPIEGNRNEIKRRKG